MGGMKRPPRRAQEIAIDRIVLPPGIVGTARVRAAIERELTRLLAEQPAQAGASVPAANVRVGAGADADAIGVAVAREIHAGLMGRGS
jgi:phosphomannomutase